MKNTIGTMFPELANLANIPTVTTPAGWKAAHGQDVEVGAVLARPMTKEEIAAAEAKAAYQTRANKIGEARKAAKAKRIAKAKAIKQTRKALEAKRAAARAIKVEHARRRRENPGTGSAYASAMVFEGKAINNEMVKQTISDVDELIDAIDAKEIERYTQVSAGSWLYEPEFYVARFVMKRRVAELTEEIAELKAELKARKNWLYSLCQIGNGLHKVWIAKWIDGRKTLDHKGKGLKPGADFRKAATVTEKEHVDSFSVLTFSRKKVNAFWATETARAQAFKPYKGDDTKKLAANAEELKDSRMALAAMKDILRAKKEAGEPIQLFRKDGRITRLPVTRLTKAIGIDPSDRGTHRELVVIHHGFEEWINAIHWKVFGDKPETAENERQKFVQEIYAWANQVGAVVGNDKYIFCFSSSSHQKDEKEVMVLADLAKVHEDYLFYGRTMEEFVKEPILAAQFLKAVANRTRPDAAPLTCDGEPVTVFDVLIVKDVKRIYHHNDALVMGTVDKETGRPWRRGAEDNPVILGDGQMIALRELNLSGQLNGEGFKGLVHNSESVINALCEKHGLTVEEFYNLEVEFFDGRRVRLGDYKIICGDGCWKLDKVFGSYDEYLAWIRRLMPVYTGIETLSILRQIDDEDGETKIRRLTRSLIQQWIYMDNNEIDQLIKREVGRANAYKRMDGTLRIMAGLDKPEEERTDLEKLFEAYPELLLNPNVQKYILAKFERRVQDGMANRLRTKGQYPYIMQDPVALLEVWTLGLNPNSNDLGILREGECSLNEVPAGKEVLVVRFPANFFTSKTLVNKPYAKVYESCGNCCVLSIYDDVLIRQDGDVDGDEMFVCYDELAISMTKRMMEIINPPVVLFEHGSKATPTAPGTVSEFYRRIGLALYKAHHDGQVGTYANVARDCAYLLSEAYVEGRDDDVQKYFLWMAAASTGAILAIDQVKGNDISKALVVWLETIRENVRTEMDWKQPYTQQFLKKDVEADDCLMANNRVLTDRIAIRFYNAVDHGEFDSMGFSYSKEDILRKLKETRWEMFTVHQNVLNDEIVRTMRANYFNDEVMDDGTEMDAKFLALVKAGKEVGLKDSLLFWWHNERAMKNRLESKFAEAEEDFYAHARKCLLDFVTGDKKPNKHGRISTKAELMTSLYNRLLDEALELTRGNGVDDSEGTFTMFILKVIAPWATAVSKNNKQNGVDEERLVAVTPDAEETRWEQLDEGDNVPDEVTFDSCDPADYGLE